MARMAATILSLRGSPDIGARKPCVHELAGQQQTQPTEEGTVGPCEGVHNNDGQICAAIRAQLSNSCPTLSCTNSDHCQRIHSKASVAQKGAEQDPIGRATM